MKIGITGAKGFIGWHMRCYLASRQDVEEVRVADRKTFEDEGALIKFAEGLDLIIHLAGVNRADPEVLVRGNIEPAARLVAAIKKTGNRPCVAYTTSIQAFDGGSPYAEGKAETSRLFYEWAKEDNAPFINVIVPHVFGEYGRPYYNSAVATFAHQIVNNEHPSIHNDGHLELIHVQDLVQQIVQLYEEGIVGDVRIDGRPSSVEEVANLLQQIHHTYLEKGEFPDISNHFNRCMFNTLRGSMDYGSRQCQVAKHEDDRGWLVETVKANSGGQCFVSTTKPGITRGNHFHLRKVERFMVLQGNAEISLRKLFNNEVIKYTLTGSSPSYVDIPTMHTHSITNVGDVELITLFWADEFFDKESPDTFFEEVLV